MSRASIDTLVKELDSAGNLPAGFGPLLRTVDRRSFIPDRVWVNREPIDKATEPDRWLAAAYTNTAIVAQFDDGHTQWPNVGEIPTCSASMPSVVVGMLDALSVEKGHSVLEIGTGTGYNAALLAKMAGSTGHVATVEVDQSLFDDARARLIHVGYENVNCVLGDGTFGVGQGARFDRIISTASVHLGRVPYEWVVQTRPGGVIVTPVRADLTTGPLVRFTVHENGTATGRMLPMGVEFMDVRSQRTARIPDDDFDWTDDNADQKILTTKPWLMFTDFVSRWALAVALPSVRYDIDEGDYVWLRDPVTGAWASAVQNGEGSFLVRQSGIRRLWDEAETAYRWWLGQGQPVGTDWEWTITPERQTIRLAT